MTKFFALVVLVVSCTSTSDFETSVEIQEAKKKKDAAVDSPPPVDAPAEGEPGWVSCYTSGNPNAACNLSVNPIGCCFDGFVAPNNGSCIETTCQGSSLQCDGDEDCASGEKCWAVTTQSPSGNLRTNATCEASTPPTPPTPGGGPYHLCHVGDGTCDAGQNCVAADPTAGLYQFSPKIHVCYPF